MKTTMMMNRQTPARRNFFHEAVEMTKKFFSRGCGNQMMNCLDAASNLQEKANCKLMFQMPATQQMPILESGASGCEAK